MAPKGCKVYDTFRSSRDKEVTYDVYESLDGTLMCECPGYENHTHCWHVKKVRARLDVDKLLLKQSEPGMNRIKSLISDQMDYVYGRLARTRLQYEAFRKESVC